MFIRSNTKLNLNLKVCLIKNVELNKGNCFFFFGSLITQGVVFVSFCDRSRILLFMKIHVNLNEGLNWQSLFWEGSSFERVIS